MLIKATPYVRPNPLKLRNVDYSLLTSIGISKSALTTQISNLDYSRNSCGDKFMCNGSSCQIGIKNTGMYGHPAVPGNP